ncbi:uncharacterized protein DS421_14g457310 [Arachis hypogaea]|nr:uncharacterized protein DS421_14g457310 [Arachis hypogaea]
MAADLRKIGAEGFALIEKYYGPQTRTAANTADASFPAAARRERYWVVHQVVPKDGMENNKGIKSHQNRWGRPIKF